MTEFDFLDKVSVFLFYVSALVWAVAFVSWVLIEWNII